ncbi:MBL fold metallo-hydrolase [Streptomyces armeniacus]|uniref:MBL fold metallo-hydrolase n=1 Tax=Streptomyces armeniacus TaxID=83291 RepID=A0A345XQC8_9ACTN|nr:MBL fold metallo-hydrolase [Streptomyces armeniacus]AXK33844.1 MBL fold metallo-hydrolase [Streptomyces armeniacus]
MELTVLGGCGAWPTARQACSGYVLESDGFRLLLDPGYATLPRLLDHMPVTAVDAVLVSHGHPDHCADLNPLLRARALADSPDGGPNGHPLPVYALPGALDAVLALDRPGMLTDSYDLRELHAGPHRFGIGPFTVDSMPLPHHVPNAGFRLTETSDAKGANGTNGGTLTYTGDTGPTADIPELARGADLLLSEATYPEHVPEADAEFLLSARLAGRYAAEAGVGRLVLTHLWPGTDPDEAVSAAASAYDGPIRVARPGDVFHTKPQDAG